MSRKLNAIPVNVTAIVRQNPPDSADGLACIDRSIVLRQHSLLAARYMADNVDHTIMQDRFGNLWSHKTNHMIVPVGGRKILIKQTNYEADPKWLKFIASRIRAASRNAIADHIPYAMGILAIYEGCEPSAIPKNRIPIYLITTTAGQQLQRLKAVNAWMAFRTWFANGLKTHHYILGQSDISRLARLYYDRMAIGDLSNIAQMYTHARDNCLLGDDNLPSFVQRELVNYGYAKSPIELLEADGISLSMLEADDISSMLEAHGVDLSMLDNIPE